MKRSPIVGGILFFLLAAGMGGGYVYKTRQFYQERIFPSIFVLGTPLENLTRGEALRTVQNLADTLLRSQVTLVVGTHRFQPNFKTLGYSINTEGIVQDALAYGRAGGRGSGYLAAAKMSASAASHRVPLRFSVNRNALRAYLASLAGDLAPQDMSIAYQNGSVHIIPPKTGWIIDRERDIAAITSELKPNRAHNMLEIPAQLAKPRIDTYAQIADAHHRFTRLVGKTFSIPGNGATLVLTPARIARITSFEYVQEEGSEKLALRINPNALYEEVKALAYHDERDEEIPDGSAVTHSGERTPAIASSLVEQTAFVLASYTGESSFVSRSQPGITRSLNIDLTEQTLSAVENGTIVKTFIISTGTKDKPTPRGTFAILNHIPVTYADTYNLYIPYWMALRHSDGGYYGYGIHGLPYYENGAITGAEELGTPASHGCIRLGPSDEKFIYNWTMGHRVNVTIHD